jgi:hypothetical protein
MVKTTKGCAKLGYVVETFLLILNLKTLAENSGENSRFALQTVILMLVDA